MKHIRLYLPNVILTLLLTFVLLGCEGLLFAKTQVLSKDNFRTVAQEEQLAEKAYTTLESYFKTRANSTGIPASVYMDVMDQEALEAAILSSVAQAFDYLEGRTETYSYTMDFTALEGSIRTFFEEYASENGYAMDQVFEDKVTSTIQEAESEIIFVTDAFKFSTMHSNGLLEPMRKIVTYLNFGVITCLTAAAVLVLLLIVCNLKQLRHLLYWLGLAGTISSALLMAPCLFVTTTDYFSAFAIKDPLIFSAVVGYLRLLTSSLLTVEIIVLAVSLLCLIVFGVTGHFCKKPSPASQAEEAEEETAETA